MPGVAGDAKAEDVDEDEDPYGGYVEQDGNTRAADLYLDTVSIYALTFSFFTHPSPGFQTKIQPLTASSGEPYSSRF